MRGLWDDITRDRGTDSDIICRSHGIKQTAVVIRLRCADWAGAAWMLHKSESGRWGWISGSGSCSCSGLMLHPRPLCTPGHPRPCLHQARARPGWKQSPVSVREENVASSHIRWQRYVSSSGGWCIYHEITKRTGLGETMRSYLPPPLTSWILSFCPESIPHVIWLSATG